MAQATFPENISTDIPREKTPAEELIDSLIVPVNEYLAALDKIQDHASAGRKVDYEH
jgi:hypothetical protein